MKYKILDKILKVNDKNNKLLYHAIFYSVISCIHYIEISNKAKIVLDVPSYINNTMNLLQKTKNSRK